MDQENKSALNVMGGIEQPGEINPELVRHLRQAHYKRLSAEEYVDGIVSGDRTILSKAITLVESSLPNDQSTARLIIDECLRRNRVTGITELSWAATRPDPGECSRKERVPDKQDQSRTTTCLNADEGIKKDRVPSESGFTGNPPSSIRIGITGVPGVGKSTFIEALGSYLTGRGHKLAVLAIDPSSTRSKGSILGDKTRMEALAVDPNAFIRPSPSAGSLGGVARKTRETIILCEAAGFDVIFIETVGVGQSETAVHSMVDFFLLLMLAGAGDELQGIKRGIIEMADTIMINKADGDNITKAKAARVEYMNALHLFPPAGNGWTPVVDICSAHTRAGIDRVWEIITEYRSLTLGNGSFIKRRMEQNLQIMRETIESGLQQHFFSRKDIHARLRKIDQEIMQGSANPYTVAQDLLDHYFGNR